jgi:CheY-like chemotaxis protein
MIYEPLTVLLIEDNAEDESLALRALRSCGLPLLVKVARDGALALTALGLGGTDATVPDLVISDLKLPKLTGDEVLHRVRQKKELKNVPYVLFSSSDDRQDVQRCLKLGASAYATKPVDYEEYVDCVQSIARRWLSRNVEKSPLPEPVGVRPSNAALKAA